MPRKKKKKKEKEVKGRVGFAAAVSKVIRKAPGGVRKQFQKTRPVGRPAKVYKRGIPAKRFAEVQRRAKRRARTIAAQTRLRRMMAMARRGIPPEIAQRMAQRVPIQAIRPVYPQQVRQYPVGRFGYPQPLPQVSYERDFFSGRLMLKPINQYREVWLR